MRRNLVGKKKPQQPKIRWSDTVSLDAGSLTGAQLKAIRDANSDLPMFLDVHWTEIADGSTNQFKKGDHMALSSAFISRRQNTMSNASLLSRILSAGTISLDRSGRAYMPAGGGTTVADMSIVETGGGSIVDGPSGGIVVTNSSGTTTRVGAEVTGTVTYGSQSNVVGSNEYFRARIKISNLTLTNNQVVLCSMNNAVLTNVEITEDGIHTVYGRFIGNGKIELSLRMCLNAAGHTTLGGCSMTLDYFYLDIISDTASPSDRIDNKTATSDDLLIGVRANGATAYTTAYDTSITAGYQRGLYKDVLVSTAYNWGRSSDLRPHHEASYVASAGNVTDDGWYGLPRLAFLPIEDVWADLYAFNSAIGAEVDPTAEWYIGHDVPFNLPAWGGWDPTVEADIVNDYYYHSDAWLKDCDVQQQTSVAAVSAPTWDGNWKRAHSDYNLFARNSTDDLTTWEYENFNSVDFTDEPNDFTLEARGIVLGAQQFFELCDDADGSQVNISGTTEAFRGARGKIVTSGHDFTVLAAGDELATSYGKNSSTVYTNAPAEFEWRMVTFIGESGQNVDITSSGIDTESSVPHWSHAGGVFGFVN